MRNKCVFCWVLFLNSCRDFIEHCVYVVHKWLNNVINYVCQYSRGYIVVDSEF